MYKYEIEEIHSINRDMQEHIDSYNKEPKRFAVYLEQNTAHLNNIANITFNDIMTPQKRQNKREEDS